MFLSKKPNIGNPIANPKKLEKQSILTAIRSVAAATLLSGCQIVIFIDKDHATATQGDSPADSETDSGTDDNNPPMQPTEHATTGPDILTEAMETHPESTSTSDTTTTIPNPETCGNGILDEGEICDYVDGVPQGLEKSDCITETDIFKGILQCDSNTCEYNLDLCTSLCGDGFISPGETCDDCNVDSGDGCNENCLLEGCGNGQIDLFEACDDGNQIDGDGCNTNCTLSTCGDGKLDEGEICDPNDDKDEPCQSNCTPLSSSCVIG